MNLNFDLLVKIKIFLFELILKQNRKKNKPCDKFSSYFKKKKKSIPISSNVS